MKAVTIDRLDIKDHVRWAQDQKDYDISFVNEAHLVAHPEFLGTSIIYPSKFEELFELQRKNQHWAIFALPYNFHLFGRRFFSYRIFPSIYLDEFDEQDDEEGSEEKNPSEGLIQEVLKTKNNSPQPQSLFEKEKTAILNLLESISGIDKMLRQINARKLQYQKG